MWGEAFFKDDVLNPHDMRGRPFANFDAPSKEELFQSLYKSVSFFAPENSDRRTKISTPDFNLSKDYPHALSKYNSSRNGRDSIIPTSKSHEYPETAKPETSRSLCTITAFRSPSTETHSYRPQILFSLTPLTATQTPIAPPPVIL